jgi:RNA polymerase sigma-70 factor, ECF subfamily
VADRSAAESQGDGADSQGELAGEGTPQGGVIDLQLVLAARAGSPRAFDVLVDRYYAAIFAYLLRLVGDRELAADLTQETFLTAYQALHRLPESQSFAAWLYRVALNRARPVLRRRRLLRFVPLEPLAERLGGLAGQSGRGPGGHEDDLHDRQAIQAVLDQLSPGQREVLLLHSLAGFTTAEVAGIVGSGVAATTRKITRARQRFRELYQQADGARRADEMFQRDGRRTDGH